jgi:hypothetical protein
MTSTTVDGREQEGTGGNRREQWRKREYRSEQDWIGVTGVHRGAQDCTDDTIGTGRGKSLEIGKTGRVETPERGNTAT